MDDDRDRPGWPFPVDAGEAARLAKDIQDLGFEAARIVVDRFSEMYGQYYTTVMNQAPWGGKADAPGPATGVGPGGGGYQRMQSDMQRMADSYLAILGRLTETSLMFMDSARSWGVRRPDSESLVIPDVAPGGRSSTRLWLHNTTPSAVVDVRPWARKLVNHAGARLPDTAVAFSPGRIARLGAGESQEILVTIDLAGDAAPGPYHGQVLVEGLPEAAFPITVRVLHRV
jgi:hypothetical protein